MKKLPRLVLWGGAFSATVLVAVGVSLLAMMVRASVDAQRRGADLQTVVIPAAPPTSQALTSSPGGPLISGGCCSSSTRTDPSAEQQGQGDAAPNSQPPAPQPEPTDSIRSNCH